MNLDNIITINIDLILVIYIYVSKLIFILFLLTLIISRFSLYYAMKIIKSPTIVYVINIFAIYVILLLSIFILKLKNINYYTLNLGVILMISGLYFVISSHKLI